MLSRELDHGDEHVPVQQLAQRPGLGLITPQLTSPTKVYYLVTVHVSSRHVLTPSTQPGGASMAGWNMNHNQVVNTEPRRSGLNPEHCRRTQLRLDRKATDNTESPFQWSYNYERKDYADREHHQILAADWR
jgi:hypothetical protein